jgi:hypothetical protein
VITVNAMRPDRDLGKRRRGGRGCRAHRLRGRARRQASAGWSRQSWRNWSRAAAPRHDAESSCSTSGGMPARSRSKSQSRSSGRISRRSKRGLDQRRTGQTGDPAQVELAIAPGGPAHPM